MISLRYHMMTIAAIFVSLGLGLILGGSIGQHWINERQQALLIGLEQKYDQALRSNAILQNELQKLNGRIEQANEEFSAFVSQRYSTDLSEKTIGLWLDPEVNDDEGLRVFLRSIGMNVVSVGERKPASAPDFPILFVGRKPPAWIDEWPSELRLHIDQARLTPAEQGELLRRAKQMYEERNDNEY